MKTLREKIAKILEANSHTQHTMEAIRPCSFCFKKADQILTAFSEVLPKEKEGDQPVSPIEGLGAFARNIRNCWNNGYNTALSEIKKSLSP